MPEPSLVKMPVYPWPRRYGPRAGQFVLGAREHVCGAGAATPEADRFRAELEALHGRRIAAAREGRLAVRRARRLAADAYELDVSAQGVELRYGTRAGLLYGLDTLLALVARRNGRLVLPACQLVDAPYKPLRGIHLYMPSREHIPFFKRLLRFLARLRLNTVFLEVGGGMEFKRHPEINRSWESFARFAGPYNEQASRRVQQSRGFWKDSVHAELAGGSYLTQAEVADLVRAARALHIEVVPEVQSLSHCYYLCLAHPEIAERAEDPFPDTYCPSNPKSYRLLFDVLDEVIRVFRPRQVHIGHDEWYTIGVCPRCRNKSDAELLTADVTRIARYLERRGIGTCMWGDKLLNFIGDNGQRYGGVRRKIVNPLSEFVERRPPTFEAMRTLSRSVVQAHWYYSLSRTIDDALVRNGWRFFYGNFSAARFQNWAGRSPTPACLGGEMSTWVEVSERVFGLTGMFLNFVLGANMLWSDRIRESSPLPPERRAGASDSGEGRAPRTAGWPTAHRAAAGAVPSLRRHLAGGPLPSEMRRARFRPLPLGRVATHGLTGRLNGVRFNMEALRSGLGKAGRLAAHGIPFVPARGGKATIGLGYATADRVRLGYRGTARSFVFLHALHMPDAVPGSYRSQDWENHTVAIYRIVYEDRYFVELPVLSEHTIGRLDARYGNERLARTFPAFPAWSDGRRTLYAFEWVNPHPARHIARIYLDAGGVTRSIFTGVTPRGPAQKGGVLVAAITAVL
ncbi:MAG: family 20 glycosylhydrolase [Kiritimatiellae bacterium]|nr:family 20 glycosylhydrolase [Kiritimatiellia bacterium]